MKNIHILPTNKLSRLGRFIDTNNLFLRVPNDIPRGINVNIYITNDEEIKDGDWFYNPFINEIQINCNPDGCKKIILTTDPDLIKDGVQVIDDEFLVWFVNNPSCESVEVNYDVFEKTGNISVWEHEIIIPKEKPKQIYYNTVGRENGVNVVKGQFNTQKEALDLANELNRKFPDLYYDWRETLIKEEPKQIKCYCGHTITCDCEPLQETTGKEFYESADKVITVEKQETLEEAVDRIAKEDGYDIDGSKVADFVDGMVKGAKWQQEKMYSEEDMKEAIRFGFDKGFCSNSSNKNKNLGLSEQEWFEQNKKKFG